MCIFYISHKMGVLIFKALVLLVFFFFFSSPFFFPLCCATKGLEENVLFPPE